MTRVCRLASSAGQSDRAIWPRRGSRYLCLILVSAAGVHFDARAFAAPVESRAPVIRLDRTASAYSVEIPLVTRTASADVVQGDVDTGASPRSTSPLTLGRLKHEAAEAIETLPALRTSIDFVNNTIRNGVIASYQFSYTCVAAACSPPGGFYRTAVQQITLHGLDSFGQDDFVQYLAGLGLLQPGADQGAVGTLLVTFSNLPTSMGWEANVIGNTYERVVESDPIQGTVGIAYNASLFFDSADTTLVGFARATTAASAATSPVRADVGIRSTDIRGSNQNLTVDLSFYDTATGARVGDLITLADVRPGELRQVAGIWSSARIPSQVTAVVIFADARNPTLSSPTIEGYVLTRETQKSQSPRFVTMRCADSNGCGN